MGLNETEIDFRKHFEDVTNGNLKTVLEYSKETRALVRELQITVESQNNLIVSQNAQLNEFRTQLAGIQTKLFSGGT